MARPYSVVFFIFILQVSVNAAPNNISKIEETSKQKLEEIANVEIADIKLDHPVTLDDTKVDTTSSHDETQGQRQKRFYNYYGYGFPPMNPVVYPNLDSGNNPSYPNSFGPEDPIAQIYRRLQDIAGVVRSPNYNQPPPPPFPFFFPVIYIPQIGCGCNPVKPKPNRPTPPRNNGTDPDVDISNRFPEMEDERQNWGFVVDPNETEPDDGQEEDFTRPISFVPIRPNRTMTRPPPPVEHGSNQGAGQGSMTMTTTTPLPPANSPTSPPAVASSAPTTCDAAVLSCCHQPQVTYDCFAAQGCPDPTSYGNPCSSQVILSVINKFQRFYSG